MVYDSNPPQSGWYSGTDDPSNNQFDLWSIASHKTGHATGWYGHFEGPEDDCAGFDQATICKIYPGGHPKSWRTLQEHDKHTLENAYAS